MLQSILADTPITGLRLLRFSRRSRGRHSKFTETSLQQSPFTHVIALGIEDDSPGDDCLAAWA
jgi:hypothetical protein